MRVQFNHVAFGNRVKDEMEAKSFRWGTVIVRSGISHASLDRMRRGEAKDLENILSVSEVLGISFVEFLTYNGDPRSLENAE